MSDNNVPPRQPGQRGFYPGKPKPAGSGAVKGQKYAKTIKREEAYGKMMDEVARVSKEMRGKTAEEIMNEMDFDPIVHLIMVAREETTKPVDKIKALTALAQKVHPDKKEIKQDIETTIIHTIGDSYDSLTDETDEPPIIEGTFRPVLPDDTGL